MPRVEGMASCAGCCSGWLMGPESRGSRRFAPGGPGAAGRSMHRRARNARTLSRAQGGRKMARDRRGSGAATSVVRAPRGEHVPMTDAMTGRPATPVRAPRGTAISCKGWPQEAALRVLMNNLDPDAAERWQDRVVYGGSGKAVRNWEAYHRIVASLRALEADETLLVQSGKPVGVFRTHPDAPRVLIANAMLVPAWGDWEHFRKYEAAGLTMYGQMTAGSWIYIGTQGILQGTYETFGACAAKHFGGTLRG